MRALPPVPRAPVVAGPRAISPLADAPLAVVRHAAKPSPALGGIGNWRLGTGAAAETERNAPDWGLPLRHRRAVEDPGAEVAEAADKLWFEMRARRVGGLSFRRRSPLGRYMVGFLSKAGRLVVEIEGDQPAESAPQAARRAAYFENKGFTQLRFTAGDVMRNMAGVRAAIIAASHEDAGDNP